MVEFVWLTMNDSRESKFEFRLH